MATTRYRAICRSCDWRGPWTDYPAAQADRVAHAQARWTRFHAALVEADAEVA